MRWLLIAASLVATTADVRFAADRPVIDNAQVRVYRTTVEALAGIDHGPGVIVSLDTRDLGKAVWADDAAAAGGQVQMRGAIVVVQPRAKRPPSPPAGSKPGDAPFTGMSFTPLFDNDRVSVLRARMEIGAREGLHTHASDTIVVHLSGGEIEDTADGKTIVNRWKRGDAEFEAFGSSHSARNVGGAVDVVLVAMKR